MSRSSCAPTVIALRAEGRAPKQIAADLGIALPTVYAYLRDGKAPKVPATPAEQTFEVLPKSSMPRQTQRVSPYRPIVQAVAQCGPAQCVRVPYPAEFDARKRKIWAGTIRKKMAEAKIPIETRSDGDALWIARAAKEVQ